MQPPVKRIVIKNLPSEVTFRAISSCRQHHPECQSSKPRLRNKLPDISARVGVLEQEQLERPFRNKSIDPTQVQAVDMGLNVFSRGITAQIHDERLAAWFEHAMHLIKGLDWFGEIFKRGATDY